MMEAADIEDKTDKAAVTPGPIAPARELLGYMQLEHNQPKAALASFEAVMKKEPNRFLAIWGAAKAEPAIRLAAMAMKHAARLKKELLPSVDFSL